MLLEIDHHSGVPIYRQVIGQIRRQIMTDGLKEGDQLESVRDLAARLKVNPMTISKAYSFLEAEGLVQRRRGIGLFIANVTRGRLDEIKTEFFFETINKAAITAIQLGVPRQQAVALFEQQYSAYQSKKRRQT